MKIIKYVVRWNWTHLDEEDPVTHTGQSQHFIALRAEDAYRAAHEFALEFTSYYDEWSDEHNIWAYDTRIVKITEELVS